MVEAVEATAVIIFNGLDFSPCRVSASANPVANEASCCLKIAKILSSNGWRKWLVCDGRNWTFTRDSNAASRDRECDGWPGYPRTKRNPNQGVGVGRLRKISPEHESILYPVSEKQ